MLEEMATVGDERIVSWQPHGKAFRVHLPDAFAKTVLPHYFKKQTKYKSFLRQLHIYGFHRIGKGIDRGAYYHSMFIRNEKSMSLRMFCKKIKGKKSSDAAHHHAAGDLPDFYSCRTYMDKDQDEDGRNLVTSALLFNQEVAASPSPPRPQLIGSEIGLNDWTEHAKTMFSRDEEEQASPYHGHGDTTSFSEKGREASIFWYGVDSQKQGDDEGFFAGKRFFHVAPPMVEAFSAVVNRSVPIFSMPRSA
jgi:hypothetical protein